MRATAARMLLLGAVFALPISACGGGGDGPAEQPFGNNGRSTQDPTSATGSNGSNSAPGGSPDELTQRADPGEAWLEVDGQRLTYTTKGSIHVACEITESRVNVNFQTSGGHDLLISASPQNGNWLGTIAVKPGGGKLVQYGASLPTDAAKFGIEAGALSFEGTVNRLENFDPKTSKDVQAKLAVNCVSAGGDPSAEIGGKSYVFPANGAQSFSCEVSPTTLDVRVNRLALEKLQLELSARIQSGKWLGTITVYTGDDRISSLIPDDGEGLLIDGQSVKYAGKFIRTSRTDKSVKEELAGTVTVTCP